MTKRNVKILLSLFAFNSFCLYLYFTYHPDAHTPPPPTNHRHTSQTQIQTQTQTQTLTQTQTHRHHHQQNPLTKPWPILPSYLPWSLNPNPPFRSCEAYFGNGFSQPLHLLKPPSLNPAGWFRCYYSETLRSSVCEGGRIRMHPERIRMSRGGERLEEVMGRGEDEELPEFDFGAFEIEVVDDDSDSNGLSGGGGDRKLVDSEFLNRYLQRGGISKHTMRSLVDSIQLVGAKDFQCSETFDSANEQVECDPKLSKAYGTVDAKGEWVEEPTLLVTRFEYANVFHTVTDWFSAYVASRVTGLPYRPNLVFVDGHCVAPLEETWRALFSNLRYAKNFTGPVCFRHAILAPLGYETALFKGLTEDIDCHGASAHDLWQKPDDRKTARLHEFGEMIRAAFGFPVDKHRTSKPVSGHNVLFVRREDYLAHPRHGGKVQSRLSNEQEVFDALKSWVSDHSECKINLINGLFAHMPMKEQVRAIQDASVIIGAHGAGLTHIVSATPKTVILEIISSEYRRPHFALIAKWKGLEYHSIYLAGSYAKPAEVIKKLSSILKGLDC
ncbi:beta-1,2-xylosyltransferase isoform X2 [Rhododendron vialii]|uniref:beta-1,2-xylosyltransferase isoform X2 n=1 Tax=Rhododendron vialii TaxID=182163 RepID=UPI00265D8D2E|nr:beta-1,2-xylosyltransferase isoform X2 [Rhododendron vialii]